jgi:periplasmic divalent cation tolerance protein
MSDLIQVVTTVDAQEKAQALAHELVKLRLAACVQIDGPVESVYRWQSKIESCLEWRLTIKTRRGVFNDLQDAIRSSHDYDIPEIVAIPIVAVAESYADWLNEQVADNPLRHP